MLQFSDTGVKTIVFHSSGGASLEGSVRDLKSYTLRGVLIVGALVMRELTGDAPIEVSPLRE